MAKTSVILLLVGLAILLVEITPAGSQLRDCGSCKPTECCCDVFGGPECRAKDMCDTCPCTSSSDCISGRCCCSTLDGNYVCTQKSLCSDPVDDCPCSSDAECALRGGKCCDGECAGLLIGDGACVTRATPFSALHALEGKSQKSVLPAN